MRVAAPFFSRNTPPLVLPSSLPKSPANTSPLGENANEVGVDSPVAKAVTVPPAGAVGRGGPAAAALDAPTAKAPATAIAASPRTLIIPTPVVWCESRQTAGPYCPVYLIRVRLPLLRLLSYLASGSRHLGGGQHPLWGRPRRHLRLSAKITRADRLASLGRRDFDQPVQERNPHRGGRHRLQDRGVPARQAG